MSLPSSVQAWSLSTDESSWKTYKSLQLRDARLSPPGEDEVLVKLHAVSLNYRHDILIPQKLYPGSVSAGPDAQGHILASDGAGEVFSVGDGVTNWSQGDRVVGSFFEDWITGEFKKEYAHSALGGGVSGTLVQYRVFPARALVRIPSHLSYEESAALPCAAVTAWASLFETAVQRPIGSHSTILVQGSGGVSMFAAQFAKAVGARVIATTSSAEKAEKYKKVVGVDEVINYQETPEWFEEVLRLTGGKGVEHVLEVGGQTTFSQSLKCTEIGGHVHILGMVGGIKENGISYSDLSLPLITGRLNLHGQAVGSVEMFRRMNEFIEKHNIEPVVDRVFEWEQAIDALDYLAAGSHFGKVVVKV